MKLVTIKTFDNPIEAHLIRSKLESKNITCYLFDENIVGLNPLYNISVGGIKLKIKNSDAEKANKIIQETDSINLTDDQDEIIKCPKCQSQNLYSNFKSMKGIKGTLSAIFSFIFLVFPIYFKTVYKCKACEYEFEEEMYNEET